MIAVLTACFVLSAVSGVERGIKYLSNANAVAAALLVFFLFVVGPTVFILGTFTTTMGDYLTQLPSMSFNTGVYDPEASTWLSGWTIFYWAWWISWTPFVGMFIARISKGRTIRQFVIYVILVPSVVSFVWFAILGGSAIDLQLNEGWSTAQDRRGKSRSKPRSSKRCGSSRGPAITVALAVLPDRDLLRHRCRRRVDRDGHAQPARHRGAQASPHRLLGRRDRCGGGGAAPGR